MSGVDNDKAPAPPALERGAVPGSSDAAPPPPVKARAEQLDFFYGAHQALKAINLPFYQNQVTALIGPSGCGKSTLLRCFNRMHDLYHGNRYGGKLTIYPSGRNLVGPEVNPIEMRMRCSMVFQKPNPFPKSIFENVAFSLRLHGIRDQELVRHKVQTALTDAALWEETKDRLHESAYALSGGQQQRLCIARALVSEPEILLFDEPTSALDPVATSRIEDLITALKDRVTIVIVTHNMQQAARVSEYTGFIFLGELIEFSDTARMFQKPSNQLTDQYIRGHFG